LCKYATKEEAETIAERFRKCGYNPLISKSGVAGIVKYYQVILGARDVAKLAQHDAKALGATLELAERKGVKRK